MRTAACTAAACTVAVVVFSAGCPSLTSYYRERANVAEQDDVSYADDGIAKHKLDVFYPAKADAPWPVVVFVHGGYWRGGDKNYVQFYSGLYGNVGKTLAELGVGGVVTNYRLHPTATLDQMLDDVVGAMKWTHDHAKEMGGDPNRIYIAGHSAGGHIVALLGSEPEQLSKRGFDPSWLKGVVGISGIYDVPSTIPLVEPDLRDGVFYPLFGTEVDQQRAGSPLFHFGKSMPPTLFMAGENDYRSCKRDFLAAQTQLAPLLGDNAFFKLVPGNTHEDMVLEIGTPDDEVAPAIAAFVRSIDKRAAAR